MGDIAFNIEKFVNLNKQVNLDIVKNVNANVNNPDQLATAEADAEAFGPNALAEVDAYTVVTPPEGEGPTSAIGSVDVIGNSTPIMMSGSAGVEGLPAEVMVNLSPPPQDTLPGGEVVPNADDINGFGSLAPLNGGLAGTDDAPLPVDDVIEFSSDLNLSFFRDLDLGDIDASDAVYTLDEEVVISFGEENLDLDGDGDFATGELTLTIPENSRFLVEELENGEIEYEYRGRPFADLDGDGDVDVDDVDSEGNFVLSDIFPSWSHPDLAEPTNATGFTFSGETLQLGIISDWSFQAGVAGQGVIPGDGGTAFAYAESTSALDLNAGMEPAPVT